MKVNSYNIEFGYELLSAVPYAYELFLKKGLRETVSGFDTEPLYYFSPKHIIDKSQRSWFNTDSARKGGLPYTFIHQPEQPKKIFPPYKEVYKNKEYKFKKPTLCICNRYNIEWSYKAINFFSIEVLDWMFENLKSQYEIVYFPVSIPEQIQDNVAPLMMKDKELAKSHGVKLFTDLCEGKSWNKTLLKIFANCEHYITMNGGYSIMASMFSGTNIIYSVPGQIETKEIKNKSFWRWYPNINNVRTLHVPDYETLKRKITTIYIDKKPCLNIIVRTHRENYLNNCMSSIIKQTYDNINIVLVCDSDNAVKYTRCYDARMLRVEKESGRPKPEGAEYGIFFPYNRYLDYAQKQVEGYILFLDDDDKLKDEDSVQNIMENVDKNTLLMWKVDFNKHGIKPSHSFGKEVTLYDVTGIGLCYHSSQIKYTDWSEWKRADYRTAKKLSENLKVKWLDMVLTGLQDVPGMGRKKDIEVKAPVTHVRVRMIYAGGREIIQTFGALEYENYKPIYESQGICTELLK